jgi:hypothetical protein
MPSRFIVPCYFDGMTRISYAHLRRLFNEIKKKSTTKCAKISEFFRALAKSFHESHDLCLAARDNIRELSAAREESGELT